MRLWILTFRFAALILLVLPVQGLCSGTVLLNKGVAVTLTDIDDASTEGPKPSLLNLRYSGSAESDPTRKTLRAMVKASPDSKASCQARMATRFSMQKGSDGSTYGKARITLYGLSYSGSVNTSRAAAGKATLKMTVSSSTNKTRTESILLTASGNEGSPKIYQKDKTGGSLDFSVAAGDTITVELELAVSAGTGFQDLPAEVDFFTGEKKVRFEGVQVEILETDPPLPISTPLPEQVFFYDNARCLNRTPTSCLVLSKGEQVDDLAERSVSEDLPDTWNDRISCLKIGAKITQVIVYQYPDFKGKSRTFSRTNSNPLGVWSLSGGGWDKSISSIVVE
ncbi:MAG: hypothetical protein A4E72_00727 [Syntrophus sp. PtaU1.Bin208]|nr:MAG: hypothetical protein A4E72_00727 [Syntrophus sp. PtaU1.Bin208]